MRKLIAPFLGVLAATVPFHSSPAKACGGVIQVEGGTVSQSGQVSLLVLGDNSTDVVLTLDVPAAQNAFGVLVPVPSEPVIDTNPVSTDDLASLDQATRPVVFVGGDDGGGDGGFLSCGGAKALDGGAPNGRGVVVGDAVAVGPVTAQWVSGADGAAVSDWLAQEGFVLPDGAQATLDDYASAGSSFLAFTRNDTASGEARVGVHFTLDRVDPAYALKMTKLGAAQSLSFTILVASADADGVGPAAPYTALTVDQLDANLVDTDYAGAVAKGVQAIGGRAFVVETKMKMSESGFAPGLLGGIIPANDTVTRLSSIMDPANLDTDVAFTDKAPTNLRSPVALADASMPPSPPPPPPSSSSFGPGSVLHHAAGGDGTFLAMVALALVVASSLARRRARAVA